MYCIHVFSVYLYLTVLFIFSICSYIHTFTLFTQMEKKVKIKIN